MTPAYQGNAVYIQEQVHHRENLQDWSLVTAYGLAAAAGIKLTQKHIEVLYWIRAEYDQFGQRDIATLLSKLENDFVINDALGYLTILFPVDPITQWLRIAGLPVLSKGQQN